MFGFKSHSFTSGHTELNRQGLNKKVVAVVIKLTENDSDRKRPTDGLKERKICLYLNIVQAVKE